MLCLLPGIELEQTLQKIVRSTTQTPWSGNILTYAASVAGLSEQKHLARFATLPCIDSTTSSSSSSSISITGAAARSAGGSAADAALLLLAAIRPIPRLTPGNLTTEISGFATKKSQ
jgi:hypothetical protein